MRRSVLWLILFTAPIGLFAQQARSQEARPDSASSATVSAISKTPGKARPTIGVALEGGGAMGLAHIGVLKWFEENHIPVDYIAGTSMGGLVAGFYATGSSPEELSSLIENLEWKKVLDDRTPYEDLSYRRKEDQRAYPNSLVFGFRHGLTTPAGLNAGHQIGLLIDRVTAPYSRVASFDDLPIPFRCVAADLVSGKSHVFQNGSLSLAMRSTMSIPGAFAPVKDGAAVYVDGGLLNNLPTDVVRSMGADIVIAVHLEPGRVKPSDLSTIFQVLEHSVSTVLLENEVRALAQADAVVAVDLNQFTTLDYDKNEKIMKKGYEAASSRAKLLSSFALSEDDWAEYRAARKAKLKTGVPEPQFIRVEGTSEHGAIDVARYFKSFQGKPLNFEKLDQTLTRLTGTGRYASAGSQLVQDGAQTGLLVRVVEKNNAPPMFQPAFEVDGSQSGNVDFTMGTRVTMMDIAGYRSEWRTDLLLGNTYGFQTELYKPFRAESKWFIAPHFGASDIAFPIDLKNDPLADYRIYREVFGVDLGYSFGRFGELRMGYEIGSVDTKLRLGTPQIPAVDGPTRQARLHYLLDRTDDPVIPRRGGRLETNFHWFDQSPGASEAFPAMDLKVGYFQPIARSASVFFEGEGGTTFGTSSTGTPQFFIGAPLRLSAYGLNEFHGNQYYLLRGGYLHDLLTLPPFVGKKVYVVGSYEIGKMYGVNRGSDLPNDVAAGLLAETALGPFFVGGSVGDSGHRKWFFQLGRVF